jgi:hypothetical protein
MFYDRNMDDILIIFDHTKITAEEIVIKINNLHRNIEFKLKYEE